jgi:hypothetical protein
MAAQPININSPARAGLNTEQAGTILSPEWATVLDNAVFNGAGLPASRKGFLSLTSSPGTGVIKRIFEYFKADGSSEVIFCSDTDIYRDVTTPTSIEGTLGISDGQIKFVNFNDKVIAFGIGTAGLPAVRTTGNFADVVVASGTAPTSRIGTAAFGRLWGVDTDGKTVRYSALLDETRWDSGDGGGVIDMSNVWPSGQDDIIAIEEFGGDLVIFGSNNTVIATDGAGSSLGIDPTALYVADTIPGQGAISQFCIARVAGDLWVLTPTGIVGLQRELVQRSTPITNLSRHIQSEIIACIDSEANVDNMTLEYAPVENLAVLVCPTTRRQFTFDTRQFMEDGTYRSSTWTSDVQTVAYVRESTDLHASLATVDGEIMNYEGTTDDGTTFAFDYESGWLELGPELNAALKFVKRITSYVFIEKNVTISYKIKYDFGLNEFVLQNAGSGGVVSEWGTFEWSDGTDNDTGGVFDINDATLTPGVDRAEWSGSIALRTIDAPGKGSGQYIKVGLRLDTNAGAFALQQLNLYAKLGRPAT